jgi:transmembrane sensor
MYKEQEEIEALIILSFSRALNTEEVDILSGWLNESSGNKQRYLELSNLWQITHPAFLPESIDVEAAEKKFMSRIEERKVTRVHFFMLMQRVAAVLILPLLALSAYLMYNQYFRNSVTQIAYQEVSAPFGMSSKVDLPDGSKVWLNSGSKLKYPIAFNGDKRNVHLSGEGFFKVHSDKNHPFIVSTNKMEVEATGTQFNVEAYLSDTITAVTLLEGHVGVDMKGLSKTILLPNQRVVLNSKQNNFKVVDTDAQHWASWKDGILAFRDEPLDDVFKRLSRTFNVDIKIQDPTIAHQLYRATFQEESLEEILRLLKLSAPIEYRRTEKKKSSSGLGNTVQIQVIRAN